MSRRCLLTWLLLLPSFALAQVDRPPRPQPDSARYRDALLRAEVRQQVRTRELLLRHEDLSDFVLVTAEPTATNVATVSQNLRQHISTKALPRLVVRVLVTSAGAIEKWITIRPAPINNAMRQQLDPHIRPLQFLPRNASSPALWVTVSLL